MDVKSLAIFLFALILLVDANKDARRLYDDLFSTYNKLTRPSRNISEPVRVKLGLKVSQLIEVVSNLSIMQLYIPYIPGR